MDERLKKRLVGATVLASLIIIFVPMLFEDDGVETRITETNIPPRPPTPPVPVEPLLPAPDEDLVQAPARPVVSHPERPPGRVSTSSQSQRAETVSSANRVKERKRSTPAAWVLQVASFTHKKNAEQLVARLRAKQIPAFSERASVDRKTVYRVRIGPEIDRRRAERMLKRVMREFKLKGQVVRYSGAEGR